MKRILLNLDSDLGFFKDPDLEKIKASNLGCEISLEFGLISETVAKHILFERKNNKT